MTKKPTKPKDMSILFNSSKGTLAQIATKTNSLKTLAGIVRQICPDLPEDVWNIGNIKQNSLVIEVKSAVWSQRLQFERVNICNALADVTNGQFDQIEIKVSPYRNKVSSTLNTPSKVDSQTISKNTANHLKEVAKNAPDGLKEKLEKLAKLGDSSES